MTNALGYKTETQNSLELDLFTDWMVENKVKVYTEIGLYAGTTFLEVYKSLRDAYGPEEPLVMIAVEYPTNPAAFAHLDTIVFPEIQKDPKVTLHKFIGSSTEPRIVEGVHKVVDTWYGDALIRGSYDKSLVFIDGDHSFAQTIDDYRAYRDSFIYTAFNDIAGATVQKNIAKHGYDKATCYHLWRGLTLDLPSDSYLEFEDHTAPNPRGIGILL